MISPNLYIDELARLCIAEFGIDPRTKETTVATEPKRIELADGAYVVEHADRGILTLLQPETPGRSASCRNVRIDDWNDICNGVGRPELKWPVEREFLMDVVEFVVGASDQHPEDLRVVCFEKSDAWADCLGADYKDDSFHRHTVTVRAADVATARRMAIAKVFG